MLTGLKRLSAWLIYSYEDLISILISFVWVFFSDTAMFRPLRQILRKAVLARYAAIDNFVTV